jgi:hypothetical protein
MLGGLISLCTSATALGWLLIVADCAIAAAYLAIPVTMAVVFRRHSRDIPLPWLWRLFVAFITACAITHLAHVWSAVSGYELLGFKAAVGLLCALVSVGTALAFAWILPDIKSMPSPRERQIELENAVTRRTQELNKLVREVHHQLGNQLQVLSSAISLEERKVTSEETEAALGRLRILVDKLSEDYRSRSEEYYAWVGNRRPEYSFNEPIIN